MQRLDPALTQIRAVLAGTPRAFAFFSLETTDAKFARCTHADHYRSVFELTPACSSEQACPC